METISTPLKIRHRTNADLYYEAMGEIAPLSGSDRFKIAAKSLVICFLAAIVFVFIPVLHFILVPVALLAGIILFFRSFKLSNYLKSPTVISCPQCKKEVSLKQGPFNWPILTECLQCRSGISINKES